MESPFVLNLGLSVTPTAVNSASSVVPNGYLRGVFYNKDGQPIITGAQVAYLQSSLGNWQDLELTFTATERGYLQVFVANESDQEVYFDDMVVKHTPQLIVQENHYYPFGMELAGISKVGKPEHRFKYMGVEKEKSFGLNWMETDWRGYDAVIGRFHGVDKIAEDMYGINPYHYSFNNPIKLNDPTGLKPRDIILKDKNGKKIAHIADGKKEVKTYTVNVETNFMFTPQYIDLAKINASYGFPDAIGIGFGASAAYGFGANSSFELVMLLKGNHAGGIYLYSAAGGDIGYETLGAGTYGFIAQALGLDKKDITPDSWNGWFNSFSAGIAGKTWSGSIFWGNSKNVVSPLPVDNLLSGDITWFGEQVSFTPLAKMRKNIANRLKVRPHLGQEIIIDNSKSRVGRFATKIGSKLKKLGSLKFSYSYYGLLQTIYEPNSGVSNTVLGKKDGPWNVSVPLKDK